MKQHRIIIVASLCILLFSSCTTGATKEENPQADLSPEATTLPTNTPEPTKTLGPTRTPTELPFEAKPVDDQLEEFLSSNSRLDTGKLTRNQRADFSQALVKKMNARRGAFPTTFKGEAYLDCVTFRMKNLTDGSSPQQQTFPLFLPVTVDEEGNLEVRNSDGNWVTIAESRGIDWNMIVKEADDPRIDWPLPIVEEENHCGGRGGPEWVLDPQKDEEKLGAQIPVVLLDKKIGQVFLEGSRPSSTGFRGFLRFLTIITDSTGNPVAARNSIATYLRFCLMEEGSEADFFNDGEMHSPKRLEDYLTNPANKQLIAMWEAIETNHAYHMGLVMDQEYIITVNSNTDNWQGLAPLKDIYPILAGDKENDLDLVLVQSVYWIKAKE